MSSHRKSKSPIKIFCSYSHRDKKLKEDFDVHLKILQRQGMIKSWSNLEIRPGAEWKKEIKSHLQEADVIVLLVSAYFLASDYCYEKEMLLALDQHRTGKSRVIPVYIRPCYSGSTPFSELQGLPRNGMPVTSWPDPHEAWANIAADLRSAVEDLMPNYSTSRTGELAMTNMQLLGDYLKWIIREYDKAPWVNRAVRLHARNRSDEAVDLAAALLQHTKSQHSSPAFLIGDFGSGKTWALKRLARDIAEANLALDRPKQIPVYISLSRILSGSSVSDLRVALRGWAEILDHGAYSYILLLDGLDEIGVGQEIDPQNIANQIVDMSPLDSRYVIACRAQVFKNIDISFVRKPEADDLALEDGTDWAIDGALNPRVVYTICHVKPHEADRYMETGPAAQEWEEIRESKMFRSLLKQPVMLPLFERALPAMVCANTKPAISEVYRLAVETWIRRDRYCREESLSQNEWQKILGHLAGLMFPGASVDTDLVFRFLGAGGQKESCVDALIYSDLLMLEGQEILRFSHRSLWEYFFAVKIAEQMAEYNAHFLGWSNLVYNYPVNIFLVPMLKALQERIVSASQRLMTSVNRDVLRMAGSCAMGRLVNISEFSSFLRESGWREDVGFGVWGTLKSADGTRPASNSISSLSGLGATPLVVDVRNNKPVTGISWYDAWQFCRWVGGRLPTLSELKRTGIEKRNELMEWSQCWHDEGLSQIAVSSMPEGTVMGINPDLRMDNVSFRVVFDP